MPGFRSLETELSDHKLPVEGEIPAWLSGTLLRNGPGKFEVGGERVRHWFDGLAMIRKYEFQSGNVSYSNRFLRTESYRDAMNGRLGGQFATDSGGLGKLLGWVRRLGPPEPTDNANVHVARIGGEFVALTEVPRWVGFDGESLETTGEFVFQDLFDPHMITAHLVADPESGDLLGHALRFGRTHEYLLFYIPNGTRRREVIASIPTDNPAYVHSIGVSADHLVLVETPLRIDILRALSPFTEGFFEMLDWQPDRDTTLYVVDRESGAVVRSQTAAPFFTFHVVNAFDDGEDVVVDLVAFEDDSIVDSLSLQTVGTGGFEAVPPGQLRRYRLASDGSVSVRSLYDGGMELPTVEPSRRARRHRYVYGQATDREGANGLVKVDTERGVAREWWERDIYVEEPRSVQRPDATAEDDGVVLAPALDVEAEHSLLLVFDATTLEELARAPVPQHNPFGFHGRFFRSETG
jgi:carotenoid cleavage dioxygenase-like enzyme